MGRCGLDWSRSEKEEVVGCCEHVITIRTVLHAGCFLTSVGNVSFSKRTSLSGYSSKHMHVFVIFCVKLSGFHGGRCSDVSGGSHVNLTLWFWSKHVRPKRGNNFLTYAMCETQYAARFGELITTSLKVNLFWDAALCLWVSRHGRFEASRFLRNVGNCLPIDTAHYSRRLQLPAQKTIIFSVFTVQSAKADFPTAEFRYVLQSAAISWT